jgi:hypothetical protein
MAAVALALTLPSFQCLDDGSTVVVDEESLPLPFERITRGQSAALEDTVEAVVTDSLDWRAILTLLNAPQSRPVDFGQVMVLFVALPAETGGYDVQFRSTEVIADTLIASYAVGVPAADCITALGRTVPFEAIAVRRVNEPVRFVRSIEPIPCTFR